ncbi:P-loop containing nucleoside triphosphate hydrolase protein [Desarmillaria tabescens]|uniref:DNA 3'-5' helicase n=1 Tax=Armillaria tabescens TaxID=1929756 RepID=A0AA39JLQ6_ARMTA|nr:P-loop containing nucleoside triphosphate hydrolase protein [Desarmillaria tabescens]KAK0444522.1 P-loop containing nucleoside triphosphate hydrolase protein [Desarmillaria tabescens]
MSPTTPPWPQHLNPSSTLSRIPGTPQHRKYPQTNHLQGIKTKMPKNLNVDAIKSRLKQRFKLLYHPDDWQAHLICRILQGYDSIFCAGTGYGKSLIFEGLVALGGKGKLVMVISPLKALEQDQVKQATQKGLDAFAINEDTYKTAKLWVQVWTTAQMVYLSPEMTLSDSFMKLWKDSKFQACLIAIVVDKAHCALHGFTGSDIPFVAYTATCQTTMFDMIWSSLGYGHRPFWSIDVGTDRHNLLYLTHLQQYSDNPVLDILNILLPDLGPDTHREDLPKTLLYLDSEAGCHSLVQSLHKCLPKHLCTCVHAFSSDLSEEAKQQCWDKFTTGDF